METTRRNLLKMAGSFSLGAVLGQMSAHSDETIASTPPGTLKLPAKEEFPGVRDKVYLNGAAIHPWPKGAWDAINDYAKGKMGFHSVRGSALANFAKLINANPDEVTYVPSTSMGEYLVTQALGIPKVGGRIVTDALHFIGSFYMYEQFRNQGMDVVTVRLDPKNYTISLKDMDAAITADTKLVAISQVSMVNGFEHDVKAICDIAHSKGALVYSDIIQAAGTVPVDVKAQGVDFAGCGTYKWLMGDFGLAFLYVKSGLLQQLRRPWYGYLQTRDFVNPITNIYPFDPGFPDGEPPYKSQQNNTVSGFFSGSFQAQAVEVACSYGIKWLLDVGIQNIQEYQQPMINALQKEMRRRNFIPMTPLGTKSPIVSFVYKNASQLSSRLSDKKIIITFRKNYFRISLSVFNDMNDIDMFLSAIGNP